MFFFSSKVAKIGKLYSYETAQYIQRTILRSLLHLNLGIDL